MKIIGIFDNDITNQIIMNNLKPKLENRILQSQLLDFLDNYGIKEKACL